MRKQNNHMVFVYGSLMKGLGNHHWLKYSKYLGQARLKPFDGQPSFSMHKYSTGFPAVYQDETTNPKATIDGEIYEVDDRTMLALDMLEGHPGWYLRRQVTVQAENGHTITVWMYVMQGERRGEEIPTGSWRDVKGMAVVDTSVNID